MRSVTAPLAVTALLIAACAQKAVAQCNLLSGPNQFEPPIAGGVDRPPKLVAGFTNGLDLYQPSGSNRKMIVTENFGYATFDLGNPGLPSIIGYSDMTATVPLQGDGQSTVVAVGAAADGSRALVNWKQTPYGTFLMKPVSGVFSFAGSYGPIRAFGGVTAVQVGGRYLGYTLTQTSLTVADVTNFVSGGAATQGGSIPSETVTNAPSGSLANNLTRAGTFLVYSNGSNVVVVDSSNPGSVGNISGGLNVTTFTASAFGLPSGYKILNVSAAIHPTNGRLYVLAETTDSFGSSTGIGLASSPTGNVNLTPVGAVYLPPAPYSGGGAISSGVSQLVPTSDDILALTWETSASSVSKLFTLSGNNWGTDLSPSIAVDSTQLTSFVSVRSMRAFQQGSTTYFYVAAQQAGYAMSMSCVASNSPATADLKVEPNPCPSGSSCPLSDGATVFAGDTLKITPTVNPPIGSAPLNGWDFDFDFHTVEDNGGSFPRIKFPDLQGGSGSTPPSTIALVGPCDPSVGGANPSDGSGCWASVTNNGSTGGPDFTTAPAAGTTKSLKLAFQAQNAFGSAGLKTFNLNWQIPAVKLKTTSVLLGGTLTDASEGHPKSSGYKWYFASQANGPSGEVLTLDANCSGPSCTHSFPSKGSYNYWLTVPYSNGYASPDCNSPCTLTKGTVSVTDVVLGFTAPTQVLLGSGSFSVGNQSTVAGSVTACGAGGYQYNLCDASGGSCSAGVYSDLTFSGSTAAIPTPANASTYWLRIKYNYSTTGTGGCGSPLIAQWTPNVVSDVTAFPVTVSNVVPTIGIWVNGVDPCAPGPGGGSGSCGGSFTAAVGDSLKAYAYVNGVVDPNPPSGLSWDFGGTASPTTATGQGAAFKYNSSGSVTVKMFGYGGTVSVTGDISAPPPPPPPPPPTTLTISRISASPNPVAVGDSTSFSASVSGGSGGNSYAWTFGDGQSAAGFAPSHIYTAAGNYAAKLTVRDSSGATAQAQVTVSVTSGGTPPPPGTVDFTIYDASTGAPILFQAGFGFSAASGQSLRFAPLNVTGSLSWDFGDGTTSTANPGIHAYNTLTDKLYTVKLTAGSSSKSYAIDVAGSSGAALTGAYTYRYSLDNSFVNKNSVTPGKAIKFTASDTADSYSWNFGDGQTGTGNPIEHTYSSQGSYSVILTVTRSGVPSATTPTPIVLTVPAPPEPPLWLLGGMAYTDGLSQTVWQSDVSIFNPDSTRGMALSVAFLDGQHNVEPGKLRWSQLVLAKLQTVTFKNVLDSPPFSLGKGNFGAILIRGDDISVPPIITGRTYNTGDGTSGTYGLSVPAVPVSGGVKQQATTAGNVLIGLREVQGKYRTNLIVANLKSDFASAEIRFYDDKGTQLGGVAKVDLAPYGVHQVTQVLTAPAPDGAAYAGSAPAFVAVVKLIQGTAVFPYATVINTKSGDPIVISPPDRPASNYRLPGIVRTKGRNDTLFQSDVVIYNPSATSRRVSLRFWYQAFGADLPAGTPFQSVAKELPLAANQVMELDDFVKSWLPSGLDTETTNYANSYVDVGPAAGDPNTDPLLILGQTYNSQPTTGNVGFQVPGYTEDDGASGGSTDNKRLVMTGLSSGASYRTNAAFFLTSPAPNVYGQGIVKVIDPSGNVVRSQSIFLTDISSFTQINDADLFAGLTGDLSNMTVILEEVSGTSAIASYATVVDNKSGDAILVQGRPSR